MLVALSQNGGNSQAAAKPGRHRAGLRSSSKLDKNPNIISIGRMALCLKLLICNAEGTGRSVSSTAADLCDFGQVILTGPKLPAYTKMNYFICFNDKLFRPGQSLVQISSQLNNEALISLVEIRHQYNQNIKLKTVSFYNCVAIQIIGTGYSSSEERTDTELHLLRK